MKEFLLSLVSPMKMKRYRFMSVFIAMLIFVASIYCIALPHQFYVSHHKDKFLEASAYVNLYMDMPDLPLGDEFKLARYRTEVGEKEINGKKHETPLLKTDRKDTEVKVYEYQFDKKLKNDEIRHIKFYIAVDYKNVIFDHVGDYQKQYDELYKDDSGNKKSAAGYITYIKKINATEETNQAWINKEFERIHNLTEDALKEEMGKLTDLDLFGIKNYDKDTYMVSLFDTYINSHIPNVEQVKDKDGNKVDKLTFPALQVGYDAFNVNYDFTKAETLTDFGTTFQDIMFKPLYNQEKAGYLLQIVGYVLIFPAIYALLLFWTMKKRGVMKTYKEYYNISSIASIIPAIITFITSWFIPNAVLVYGILFCVAALFIFIKINSTPEQLA